MGPNCQSGRCGRRRVNGNRLQKTYQRGYCQIKSDSGQFNINPWPRYRYINKVSSF